MPFSSAKFLSAVSTRLHSRYGVRRFSRLHLNVLAVVAMSIAFIAGSYFTLSQVLLPMIRALTETTTQMPLDVAFDRLTTEGLVGYDNGGGATFVLSSEVKLATSSSWWVADYTKKKQLTVRNLSTIPLATQSATTQQITLNTKALYDAGSLKSNCEDLRVVFIATESSNLRRELPRSFYPATGATNCADSTATTIAFPLQEPVYANGGTSPNYELYYGNPTATDPNYTDQGYSITRQDGSTASATLVCPFNGSTTCVGGETPTTATGAIRYSGGSALRFDGINDEILFDATSTLGTTQYTVDVWFKVDDINNTYKRILEKDGNKMMFYVYGSTITFTQQRHTVPQFVGQVSASGVQANTWHRVTVVRNGTNFKIFLDGILKQSTTGADYVGLAGNYRFGYTWGSNTAPISLDEFRLSNVARYSSSFDSYATPFETDPNTVLLWHFDENGDDPRNTGKAIDSSGNGNHGTITGAKYVSGLVGVDNSSSTTGAIPASTYASHQGVFIEEGTTNLITNPSFDHTTYNTNWGTNYFNYATTSATFTPSMAKRNSAGPFAAGVMVQGRSDASYAWNNGDSISWSQSNIAGSLTSTIDRSQGSIVFWITPEWNGNDGKTHYIFGQAADFALFKHSDNRLVLYDYGWSYLFDISDWTAGSTYNIVR